MSMKQQAADQARGQKQEQEQIRKCTIPRKEKMIGSTLGSMATVVFGAGHMKSEISD